MDRMGLCSRRKGSRGCRMKSMTAGISPLTVIFATAILVIASSAVANHFLGKSTRTIDPRVSMENKKGTEEKESKEKEQRRQVVTAMDGEVARTTDRVGGE